MLRRLEVAAAKKPTDRLIIDLSRCRYLGPDAVACLAAVILEFRFQERQVEIVWPTGPEQLREYCVTSGLKFLMGDDTRDIAKIDSDNVIELRQLSTSQFNHADPVVDMLKSHIQLGDELEEYLRYCVLEIIQNTYDHSRSPIGGILAARFLSKVKEIRIAFVDRGAGIRTTLSTRFPDLTPDSVLRRVVQGRYSALSRENNAGLGISMLVSWVTHLGGELSIISEESWTRIRRSQRLFEESDFRFCGTGVFFTIPVV